MALLVISACVVGFWHLSSKSRIWILKLGIPREEHCSFAHAPRTKIGTTTAFGHVLCPVTRLCYLNVVRISRLLTTRAEMSFIIYLQVVRVTNTHKHITPPTLTPS